MDTPLLSLLEARGVLDPLDREFAEFLQGLAGETPHLGLAAALASRVLGQGDVCLELPRFAGLPLLPGPEGADYRAPAVNVWREALRRAPVVGEPGEFQPLILDGEDRLYLYRYWCYEDSLARQLRARAEDPPTVDPDLLREGLARLFPEPGPNRQKLAAAVAACNRLAIISGGPGTGKTTTLARVLALLLAQQPDLRIRLAAPTGKAAARMQEAVQASKRRLAGQVDEAVLTAIPEEAATLHRLLGVSGDGLRFRHGPDNLLSLDLLAVDEASMVDLALLSRTVAALPAGARLLLLGDRDQLSSVEAGAVLGELCRDAGGFSRTASKRLQTLTGEDVPVAGKPSALMDQVTLLERSYRFEAAGGIGQLASLIRASDGAGLTALLRDPPGGIRWLEPPPGAAMEALLGEALDRLSPYLQTVRGAACADEVFESFGRFQLLCPQRSGEWGVENLNRRLEERVRLRLAAGSREWYPGRAVMVTRNDYTLRLFNGDIGIVLPDPGESGQLRACFRQSDGGIRAVALSRLPPVEPVFAMTVHKSQGSEFDEVLLVLPAEDSPVLSRELLYTAVTRARERLSLWGSPALLGRAVTRSGQRASGLRARLAALA